MHISVLSLTEGTVFGLYPLHIWFICKMLFGFMILNHETTSLFQGYCLFPTYLFCMTENQCCISVYIIWNTNTLEYIENISMINGFVRGISINSQGLIRYQTTCIVKLSTKVASFITFRIIYCFRFSAEKENHILPSFTTKLRERWLMS